MNIWTDKTGQRHKVKLHYTHKMYRMSGSCECGWSQDYIVAPSRSDEAQTILETAHYEFIKAGA